jgi:two-component system, cell cycle response regulator
VKVLVAEDDAITSHLLQSLLVKAGYEPVAVDDGAKALKTLDEPEMPRLLILDWMMPQVDGVELCRIIRKDVSRRYVYVILLTARGKQEEINEGLEAGADDYITKPFDFHELVARLRTGKRILELQDQLVAQATHDSLTGLLNREAILEVLDHETARAVRNKTPLAVIMADIDHFKSVNDEHGHLVGDSVLREAAKGMLNSVRAYDSVGRYGGEEFLIVAPGCGLGEASQLAERLRRNVKKAAVKAPGVSVPVTISFGVADVSICQNASDLLRSADEALYAAKRSGRDRVEASSEMRTAQ